MKFAISRASEWNPDVCPWPGAVRDPLPPEGTPIESYQDHLIWRSNGEALWQKRLQEGRLRGIHMRRANLSATEEECGYVVNPLWRVEVDSLETLLEMLNAEDAGQGLVLKKGSAGPEIVVYDDYIE